MQWEVKKWFGNPIFITKLDNYQTINREILRVIYDEVKPSETAFATTTDVKASDSKEISDSLHHNFNFEKLFNEIQKQIDLFLNINQYKMEIFDTYITKAWATFSTKGQRIASHKHTASHYSLVYYVEAEEQGNVVFEVESALKGGMHIPARDEYYKGWTDINFASVTYPSETGGLIIFPSNLLHRTEENTKERPRISISADVLLTMKEGIKSEHCLPNPKTWRKIC